MLKFNGFLPRLGETLALANLAGAQAFQIDFDGEYYFIVALDDWDFIIVTNCKLKETVFLDCDNSDLPEGWFHGFPLSTVLEEWRRFLE